MKRRYIYVTLIGIRQKKIPLRTNAEPDILCLDHATLYFLAVFLFPVCLSCRQRRITPTKRNPSPPLLSVSNRRSNQSNFPPDAQRVRASAEHANPAKIITTSNTKKKKNNNNNTGYLIRPAFQLRREWAIPIASPVTCNREESQHS